MNDNLEIKVFTENNFSAFRYPNTIHGRQYTRTFALQCIADPKVDFDVHDAERLFSHIDELEWQQELEHVPHNKMHDLGATLWIYAGVLIIGIVIGWAI